MLATRSSTEIETRECRGGCGRWLPLTLEHFSSAGRKLSGAPKYRSRCKRCMRERQDAYRESLRAMGEEVCGPLVERESGPRLPALMLGRRVQMEIDREVQITGRGANDVWTGFARRSGIGSTGDSAARTVATWRSGERKTVVAAAAVDALGAVGLHLVDVYSQQLLDARLPPVSLDD